MGRTDSISSSWVYFRWAPLTHTALPIFKPSLSDEADLLQSFDVVSEMFELACAYSAKHTWVRPPRFVFTSAGHRGLEDLTLDTPSSQYLASQTALLDALALHEAACVFLALSTDPSLAARGLEGLKGRGAGMESVLKGMSGEERESEDGKELTRLACLWEGNLAGQFALPRSVGRPLC